MFDLFLLVIAVVTSAFKSRHKLALENLALRQQVALLKRSVKRPRVRVGGNHPFGKCQRLTVSLKQTFERQVSGKAAAQPRRKVRVRTCLCRAAAIDWVPSVTEAVCGVSDRLLLLRKQQHRPGMGMCAADHHRWPNVFFARHGLFTLETAHATASRSR